MLGGTERSLLQDFPFHAAAQDFHSGAAQSDARAKALMQGFVAGQTRDAVTGMIGQHHADFSRSM